MNIKLNKRGESFHSSNREVVQLRQRHYDRFYLAPSKLAERYRRNNLGVLLHVKMPFGLGNYALFVLSDTLKDNIGRDGNSSSGVAQDQFFMFIRNVHVVKDQQVGVERIGGRVWLEPLNLREDAPIGDSAYFSFVLGKAFTLSWPHFENWKTDCATVFPDPVALGRKVPCEMVKAGAEMVDDLASQNAETQRNGLLLKALDRLKQKLHIVVGHGDVAAFLEEGINLPFKILNVFAGPI